MVVSVLSALARLEIDPWQEAAKLASLPTHAARAELANAIAQLADVPRARTDPQPIADRLIALLPPNERSRLASPLVRFPTDAASKRLITLLLLVVLALGSYVSAVSVVAILIGAGTPPISQDTDEGDPAFDKFAGPGERDHMPR